MILKHKVLEFLHKQLNKKAFPFIKPGMIEDLEEFVTEIISEIELEAASYKMRQQLEHLKAEAAQIAKEEKNA